MLYSPIDVAPHFLYKFSPLFLCPDWLRWSVWCWIALITLKLMWKGSFWILTTWLCSFQLENYYFNSSPVLIQYFWNIQINQTFADLIQHRSIWRQARENMQPGLGAERTLNNNVQQTKEERHHLLNSERLLGATASFYFVFHMVALKLVLYR